MSRKTEIIDDDGNVLPPPEPGSPVAQIIYLLEYGRKRGFRIGPMVQIGDVTVQARDLRQEEHVAAQQGGSPSDLSLDPDMALLLARQQGGGT